MSKMVIRLSVLAAAAYLVMCYVCALAFGISIWSQTYHLLFEACVCLCISKQGIYHCRYVKWTAYGLLLHDSVVCSDVLFGYMPWGIWVCVPALFLAAGLSVTTVMAVRHYCKIRRIKRKTRKI